MPQPGKAPLPSAAAPSARYADTPGCCGKPRGRLLQRARRHAGEENGAKITRLFTSRPGWAVKGPELGTLWRNRLTLSSWCRGKYF